MTLIRHNVRVGSQQAQHFAHDTDKPDTNGCYVSGKQGRVFTSAANPCPQCGGWGGLVAIDALPRAEYPQGSVVPDRYRAVKGSTIPTPAPVTKTPVTQAPSVPDTSEVDTWTPQVSDTVGTTVTGTPAASDTAKALTDLLATLVPDAAKIRADIDAATSDLRETLKADTVDAIGAAIGALLVPVTVKVQRPDRDTVTIEGAHAAFTECLQWLNAGRNIWLVGPAGCGKTTLARHLAEALSVPFYTTGQVLSEHQVTGFVDAGGTYHTTPFRQAFEHGGVWLGDEMDSWSPEAALAANAALANGHASFPDSPEPIAAHDDFYVIAAANTFGHGADREYVGRNEMDAATLDRFVTVPVDYDKALETQLAGTYQEWLHLVWSVRAKVSEHRIRKVVGTRAVVFGVSALATGMPLDLVTTRILRGDLDDSTWAKVSA